MYIIFFCVRAKPSCFAQQFFEYIQFIPEVVRFFSDAPPKRLIKVIVKYIFWLVVTLEIVYVGRVDLLVSMFITPDITIHIKDIFYLPTHESSKQHQRLIVILRDDNKAEPTLQSVDPVPDVGGVVRLVGRVHVEASRQSEFESHSIVREAKSAHTLLVVLVIGRCIHSLVLRYVS